MHHTYSETKSKSSLDAVILAVLGTLVPSFSLGLLVGAICGCLCNGLKAKFGNNNNNLNYML